MSAARRMTPDFPNTDSTDHIHRCETVPPPGGEDDPYNAATKVGPMARAAIEQLMAQAEQVTNQSPSIPPISETRPLKARRPLESGLTAFEMPPTAPIPHLFEDDEEGDQLDPTGLFQSGETVLRNLGVMAVDPSPPIVASSSDMSHASDEPHSPFLELAPALELAPSLELRHRPRFSRARFSRAELAIAVVSFAVALPALYFLISRI
jgi:hypothetical protein